MTVIILHSGTGVDLDKSRVETKHGLDLNYTWICFKAPSIHRFGLAGPVRASMHYYYYYYYYYYCHYYHYYHYCDYYYHYYE